MDDSLAVSPLTDTHRYFAGLPSRRSTPSRARRAHRAVHDLYQAAVASLEQPAFAANADGHIVWTNRAFESAFAGSPDPGSSSLPSEAWRRCFATAPAWQAWLAGLRAVSEFEGELTQRATAGGPTARLPFPPTVRAPAGL